VFLDLGIIEGHVSLSVVFSYVSDRSYATKWSIVHAYDDRMSDENILISASLMVYAQLNLALSQCCMR
jgi:hypothetical protein